MRRLRRRTARAFLFLLIFIRELILSNLAIARAVLTRPRATLNPNFITYDVSGLKPWEILLLSHCITLTPGTTTVDISSDMTTLVLHVFDATDPDAVRLNLDRRLKNPMLDFTR